MSRITTTNGFLNDARQDIARLTNASPAFSLFFKDKINRFWGQNKLLLKILDDRLSEFARKYAKHDEEGKPILEKKEGADHYTFETPEKEKEYKDAVTEFFNREIYIEL
jgi:hypothetical protein